nr:unnamed protein product [Digitaria exilis]
MVAAPRGGMEFAAMKRRELLELCRQHGLGTRGSKADLAVSLAGAISGAAAATTAESVVEVVVGKGCLKRLGGSASGGTSSAAKKVRFSLDEEAEERARMRMSQMILQPVVTKTRGRRRARKIHPAAAVSGRGCGQKRDDVGGHSVDNNVVGEVNADAPVMKSAMEVVCLCAQIGAERLINPAEAEKEGEVVEAAIDSKRKQKTHENVDGIGANAGAGVPHGSTGKSSLPAAAVLLSAVVENKRGRKVGGDKDELGVQEQAAQVQDLAMTVSPVDVENERSRRKDVDCVPALQKSSRTTRSHSVAAAVILPIVTGNKVRKAQRVRPDGELPADLKVPRNDAPVTRSLRNRIFQVYNSVMEETRVDEKLEDKRKTDRPSTCRHQ